jgi:cytolysin-activating lysine-acyltransferase
MVNQRELELSANFGSALRVLLGTDRKLFKLASISIQLVASIKMNQMFVLYNERGAPVAYAVWAYLSDQVSTEMAANESRLLHCSEWNEGLNLWLIDFVAPFGHARELASKLRHEVFSNHSRLRAVRTNDDGTIRRVIDRQLTRHFCQIEGT